MKLTKWGVTNFKSLKECDLELSDINIVLGANSIGKSSLVHSMVSINEYSAAREIANSIKFSGEDLDMGNNLSFSGDTEKPTTFHWSVNKEANVDVFGLDPEIKMSTVFEAPNNNDDAYLKNFESSAKSSRDSVTYSLNFRPGIQTQVTINSEYFSRPLTLLRDKRGFRVKNIDLERETEIPMWLSALETISRRTTEGPPTLVLDAKGTWVKGPPEGFEDLWSEFMKSLARVSQGNVSKVSPEAEELVDSVINATRLLKQGLTDDVRDEVFDVLLDRSDAQRKLLSDPKVLDEVLVVLANRAQVEDLVPIGSQNGLRPVLWQLSNYLDLTGLASGAFYLGPIRAITPRQQENKASSGVSTKLGVAAENLAFLLSKKGSYTPDIGGYVTPNGIREDITLLKATEEWLEYLGIAVKIEISESRGLGPLVEINGRTMNQVGSGISQMLPVVVLSLLASNNSQLYGGSLVLLEQPELHLHPSSQAMVGDLLAAFASQGVQFVVETHSEYIVTRLRLLVAKQKTSSTVSLIFAESDGDNGAKMKRNELDAKGKSNYWPKGFMEQAMSDRISLSGMLFLDEE